VLRLKRRRKREGGGTGEGGVKAERKVQIKGLRLGKDRKTGWALWKKMCNHHTGDVKKEGKIDTLIICGGNMKAGGGLIT